MELLELLQKGDIATFNATRSARTRPDLFAAELPEANLTGADLSQANLEKADLTGADLTDATLVQANASGSDGSGINLTGVLGLKVRLRGAWWDHANLDGADLSRGDLTEIVLQNATGDGVRLAGAKLRHADLTEVHWPDVELTEARLHHAKLVNANLTRADLTECVATEADFSGATLDGIIGTNANFNESNLTGARLVGGRLQEASFAQCDLTEADFSGCDMTRANLSGATLVKTQLSGACLADANLEGCDLSQAMLAGADLTGHDPRALGLSDEAIEGLASWGAPIVEDAPLVVNEPAAARHGDKVALLWVNPDTETLSTLRWALIGAGEPTLGSLPMSAEGIQSRAVVPTADGFLLVLVQDRPGGAALVRVPLSLDGSLGPSATSPLGYPPAVIPVVEYRDQRLWITGLARRGPTLVVQRLGDDGLEVVHSERVATATGFYNDHHAVVATRGGVVIGVGRDGTGKPTRSPQGFPGKAAKVVPTATGLIAVWFEPPASSEMPGFLRWSELGGRGQPAVHTLKEADRVTSLDAVAGPDGVEVAWVERHGLLSTLVFRGSLPSGQLAFIEAVGDGGHEVRFARGSEGEAPAIVVATLDEAVIAVDGDQVIGKIGD